MKTLINLDNSCFAFSNRDGIISIASILVEVSSAIKTSTPFLSNWVNLVPIWGPRDATMKNKIAKNNSLKVLTNLRLSEQGTRYFDKSNKKYITN